MAANQNNDDAQFPEKQSDKKQHDLYYQDHEYFDYSPRGQWLRAAVLGANDGLLYVACLMIEFKAGKLNIKTRFLLGLSYLVAGAVSIAVREYVSVCSQLDVELAQMKRDKRMMIRNHGEAEKQENPQLPNPTRVAIAASVAFSSGAIVPLLVGSFIMDYDVKLGVVVGAVSLGLVFFGWVWSVVGGTPVVKSCFRVLFGGLIALGITFGQNKLNGSV